jgi:hypothetical protein
VLPHSLSLRYKKWYPSRQYFTVGNGKDKVTIKDGDSLKGKYDLVDGGEIYFKVKRGVCVRECVCVCERACVNESACASTLMYVWKTASPVSMDVCD